MKITVRKAIANGGTKFIYPDAYQAQNINVTAYQHHGDSSKMVETEFLIGMVNDDFVETDDMVTIPLTEYELLLAEYKPAAQ